jgi:hypothetical protein
MQQRRTKQTSSLEVRMAEEARRLRALANGLPPGPEREELLLKARRAETAATFPAGSHPRVWPRRSRVREARAPQLAGFVRA